MHSDNVIFSPFNISLKLFSAKVNGRKFEHATFMKFLTRSCHKLLFPQNMFSANSYGICKGLK